MFGIRKTRTAIWGHPALVWGRWWLFFGGQHATSLVLLRTRGGFFPDTWSVPIPRFRVSWKEWTFSASKTIRLPIGITRLRR